MLKIGRYWFEFIKKENSFAFKICYIPIGRIGWSKGWVLWQRGPTKIWTDRVFAFLGKNSFHQCRQGSVYNTLHFRYFVKCEYCGNIRLRNPVDLFWKFSHEKPSQLGIKPFKEERKDVQ